MSRVRRLALPVAALGLATLAACGGGGAGSSSKPPPPPPLPTGSNVAPLIVDAGAAATVLNIPSVSVTICSPGTTNCQTIDHILVDTGSSGLRIMAAALTSTTVSLPPVKTAASEPLYECFQFADGNSWGSVRLADVQVADGKAANVKIQLIGISGNPTPPCNASQSDIATFGAKGVLGVSVFLTDCGAGCASAATPGGGIYYVCPAVPCVGTPVSPQDQLQNPVSQFATNNNGVIVFLPPITAVGKPTVDGALVLGIDTQSNNQLGSATVLSADPLSGSFTTIYKGHTYAHSAFIDSGSNGSFFADASLPACTANPGWYCPPTAVTLSAINQGVGASSATSTVSFSVASLDALSNANPGFAAYDNIAGPLPTPLVGFDWGLPFFFGRSVAVAFETKATAAGTGPFFAYADFQ